MSALKLTISQMGARGEGVADDGHGATVYVPYALPGEVVEAEVHGQRGRVREIVAPSPERAVPPCPHFGQCGGCLTQHWAHEPYAAWKRQMVVETLARRGLHDVDVAPLLDAHGAGRRRVTLTVERGTAGFMAHRSHNLVEIDRCPVLVPALADASCVAVALARAVGAMGAHKALKVHVLASDTGLDCELAGIDDPELDARVKVAEVADRLDLARVTASGELLIERRRPVLDVDGMTVSPPPGGFAQATAAGEQALAGIVVPALAGHAIVADLFCGWGAFGLRLARRHAVLAMDSDKASIAALDAAVRATSGLKPLVARARDLMRDPLTSPEMKGVTGVVFDPPRAGAAAQAAELVSAPAITTVVAVSCDAGTFARDAAMLVQGGFTLARVVPVDQFRHTPHVEMAGVFNR